MTVSNNFGWYDVRELDSTIATGGDDTAKIRAAIDTANNGDGCTVVLGQRPQNDYIVEGTLELFANETLVVPAGTRLLRPNNGNIDPLVSMVRNYARIIGDGWIESQGPTPRGSIKFGPPGYVQTYTGVAVANGDTTLTITTNPTPLVGDIISVKCSDPNAPHFQTTVVATTATTVTVADPIPVNCVAAKVYILDGAPQNVLWSHARDLKMRGDGSPESIAVLLQSTPQGSGFGTFANMVENVHTRNFGESVVFDAQANGNSVHHIYPYFVSENVIRWTRSDENEVDGGFVHNSFGTTVFKGEDCFGNVGRIMAEPGGASKLMDLDADTRWNQIFGGDNTAGSFTDLGSNNSYITRDQAQFGQRRLGFYDQPTVTQPPTNADIHTTGLAAAP